MAWQDWITVVYETSQGSYEAMNDFIRSTYDAIGSALGVEPANGSVYVSMPTVVSGTGVIEWKAENGNVTTQTGTLYFTTDVYDGMRIFSAGGVSVETSLNPDFSGTPSASSISFLTNNTRYQYTFTISNRFNTILTVSPGLEKDLGTTVNIAKSTRPLTQYQYNSTSYVDYGLCRLSTTSISNVSGDTSAAVLLPSGTATMNDVRAVIIEQYNIENPSETVDPDDFISYDEFLEEQNPTEPTEPTTDSNGNVVINNYDTLNIENTVSGDADIDFNGNVTVDVGSGAFASGAFGAGAFADVDVNINAGAFGVGALGAGALGQVDVNGAVTINGNAITMDGGSITNYYFDSGAVLEFPTFDYDEILSERELELILTSETYEIAELETETLLTLEEGYTLPPPAPLPEGLVSVSAGVVSDTWAAFDSWGLTSVYLPLAIVTIVVFVLRGAK